MNDQITEMDPSKHPYKGMAKLKKNEEILLIIISFLIVAFGQPAWSWICGIVAASIGYALFWRVLLSYPSIKHRFWIGTVWFTAVQCVQLSWSLTHPYSYIYAVYAIVSFAIGAQFGLLSMLITPNRLKKMGNVFAIAGIWTILEWTRLFILSGYTWNPVGLALSGNVYSLQLASLVGIFGLSFWVMLTNMLALRAWRWHFTPIKLSAWLFAFFIPFVYGYGQVAYQTQMMEKENQSLFHAVLVQTAFPVEESMSFDSREKMVQFVSGEWRQILNATKQHLGKQIDLIALPEFVVPFGTYTFIYPHRDVVAAFKEIYGAESVAALPDPEPPLAQKYETAYGSYTYVNNAYWTQAIANCLDAGLVCGLEDCEDVEENKREYYSSAFYFQPQKQRNQDPYMKSRYDKRILVPMGEYIPFSVCRKMCESYGITNSFTPGTEPKVWDVAGVPCGLSICYEETFGDLMRESRMQGAQMHVNLTSDVWYPNSRLPRQHLEHSRLRTVETGVPLVRACNTGVTGAVDSLGRDIAILGYDEWQQDSLYVEVPTYHYQTLYSKLGDGLIIGISLLATLLFFRFRGTN